ncbi:hypothetical protein J2Z21_008866 [Streptomyces griseochromogenes]|uniref:Uncharacterized protein n=1 Tax=Streptomyces griseochromogenes TaxID=68214 RepID=A0A1B1AZ36_9ACTN|nr:hypothetical protein [Streptomyces griseochromogenes]ANP51800.1 hypothetical protein AVL59_21375 [Streptomyces griseochromogenes]MBP2055850.1 hypothetical protein [Streptomyces griseochromogenes]
MFGIGRFPAGRPMDGEGKTDATFWRSGTRILPKVEGRVRHSSYRAGWQRLAFRIGWLGAAGEGVHLASGHPDTTAQTVQDLWENREATLATPQPASYGGDGWFQTTSHRPMICRSSNAPVGVFPVWQGGCRLGVLVHGS